MKINKYSYFSQQNDGNVVCMNLIDKTIFALSQEKYELLKKYFYKLEQLKVISPHFFSALQKLGIIVNEQMDETNMLVVDHRRQIYNNSSIKLTIVPTLECNFNCWYCYEKHPAGIMTRDISRSIERYVESFLIQNNTSFFHLDWFGGEPLLAFDEVIYPLSKNLMSLLEKSGVTLLNGITTNGALITTNLIKKFNEIKLNTFQITLDGDEKLHNKVKVGTEKRNEYKLLLENIFNLCDNVNDFNLLLRINYTKYNIDSIYKIMDDIPDHYRKRMKILLQQVWQTMRANSKAINVEEIIQEMKHQGFLVQTPTLLDHMYKCYADVLANIVITHDAKVFKCTARDFSTQSPDGYLENDGNIRWTEIFYKRMSKTTFEYENCLSCNLLPACCGPCSQKLIEYNKKGFNKICNYSGVEKTIKDMLNQYYKSLSLERCKN